MSGRSKEWFSEWFDSPYYHILYKHRDQDEAKLFIDKLFQHLNFGPDDKILDAACGQGRHAIYLNEKGLNVTGIDLSKKSISYASMFGNKRLKFYVHDMRREFRENRYNYIINLFTSFGYFENEEDNYKTMAAFSKSLKKNGRLILDFMNTGKIVKELVPQEIRVVEGINFHITRNIESGFIMKDIFFNVEGTAHHYREKVRIIHKEDFLKYLNFAGMSLIEIFGNYELKEFDPSVSDRMIFVAEKKQ
jgi:SAM-dependent methyltransferase